MSNRVYAGLGMNSKNALGTQNYFDDVISMNRHTQSRRFTVAAPRTAHCRGRMIKNLTVLLCIAILISLFSIILVKGSNSVSTEQLNKYYKSITIEHDDTLWNLADTYNSGIEDKDAYINTVKNLNNMTSDTLYAGESLVVYYYSSQIQ